jgi:hypothetical protein
MIKTALGLAVGVNVKTFYSSVSQFNANCSGTLHFDTERSI